MGWFKVGECIFNNSNLIKQSPERRKILQYSAKQHQAVTFNK